MSFCEMLAPAFIDSCYQKKKWRRLIGQLWGKVLEGGVCSSDTKAFLNALAKRSRK